MSSEQMYRCCWEMACELLQGLEKRDLVLIEDRLRPLRHTLAIRHCLTEAAMEPEGLLWLEQLDLLEGITESVEESVSAMRRSIEPHLTRMRTAESLLRHLVQSEDRSRQATLPVC